MTTGDRVRGGITPGRLPKRGFKPSADLCSWSAEERKTKYSGVDTATGNPVTKANGPTSNTPIYGPNQIDASEER